MTNPRSPVRYLSVTDVIALHHATMRRLGYAPAPLRSEALLDSAVQRPRAAAFYADADLIQQSALLAVGISQAQAFLDGNKRTAYEALDVFLRANGIMYSGAPLDLARQLELVAERTDSLEAATDRLDAWLREHTTDVR